MDDKGRALQGRLDFFEHNVKVLQSGIKAVLKSHEEGVHATMDLSKKVREIAAQEQFIELQEDLIAIAETMKGVADHRHKIVCERGDQKLVGVLKFIHDKIVHPIKMLLKDRDRAYRKYNSMKTKIGATGDPRNHVTTEEEAIKYQKVSNYLQCVKNTDEIVDSNFRCFEKERVVELKILLEELLRAEMLYHCKAIETLEPMCVAIRRLQPDKAMEKITQDIDRMNGE